MRMRLPNLSLRNQGEQKMSEQIEIEKEEQEDRGAWCIPLAATFKSPEMWNPSESL